METVSPLGAGAEAATGTAGVGASTTTGAASGCAMTSGSVVSSGGASGAGSSGAPFIAINGGNGSASRAMADAERDALAELAECRVGELPLELGLAREQDLQDLLARRLEIREKPELLEHAGVEVLRFVDQQRDVAAGARVLDQELVQAMEPRELPGRLGRDPELHQDVLEDLVEADRRVHQEDGPDARVERVQEVAEQRRLSRARLADEREKALPRLDAVGQRRQRLLVRIVQVQEARVRGDIERLFLEPVERGVHRNGPNARKARGMPARRGPRRAG